MARFTVDTQLFRELGAYLVGRDSTALVELIKNAYDADATVVTVMATGVDRAGGTITITDDGIGMTPEAFEQGFLTVASRSKNENNRRSPRYGRRYTGAKGIGRLSAHKLACQLSVSSQPDKDVYGPSARQGVEATIDWDEIERHRNLDDVGDGLTIRKTRISTSPGTVLTLARLRSAWGTRVRVGLLDELQTFSPPPVLEDPLPETVVEAPVVFSRAEVRQSRQADPGFRVELAGDFATSTEYWAEFGERMDWVIEISARRGQAIRYGISPTRKLAAANPHAKPLRFEMPHPDPRNGPFFDCRILVRGTRRLGRDTISNFIRRNSGVRIYMEGFRVLPYGETGNDWLELDTEYTARRKPFAALSDLVDAPEHVEDEELQRLVNVNYFGAVFLTEDRARGMRMLVNREGFIPDVGLVHLRNIVRTGIDLSVRTRAAAAAAKAEPKSPGSKSGPGDQDEGAGEGPPASSYTARVRAAVESAQGAVTRARAAVPGDGTADNAAAVDQIGDALLDAARAISELQREQSLLRVLASLGAQFASFVHDINALLAQSQTVRSLLGELIATGDMTSEQTEIVNDLGYALNELVLTLTRQSAFLTDVLGAQAEQRRVRLRVVERFDAASRLLQLPIQRRNVSLRVSIAEDLRTPPMLASELTVIFVNLLTNAIKAAGANGRIAITAEPAADGGVSIVMENTGAAVDLEQADELFRPFTSTTVEVDELLGQGMGLGLPITRRLIADNGGEVEFVRPHKGYATAIRFTLVPGRAV